MYQPIVPQEDLDQLKGLLVAVGILIILATIALVYALQRGCA
jgi:hypothetical protein